MKTYLVGGAVRDKLMGREVNDFDYLVVGATVEQMEARFSVPVGASFPVYLEAGAQYAMARREKKIGVGYHGFAVEFGPDVTLEEDLKRRDLTINALAEDTETGEIVDCFGGLRDLENKILRHTSDAFSEDPLRVVRLARFYARYSGFTVHKKTIELSQRLVDSGEMDALPFERYWLEIGKSLEDGNVQLFFDFLKSLGAFSKIKFFREVWGEDADLFKFQRITKAVKAAKVDDELLYFSALTVKRGLTKNVAAAPNLMFDIYTAMKKIQSAGLLDVESLYDLARFIKAWTQSTFSANVIQAVGIMNGAGYTTGLFPEEIIQLVKIVQGVTSEPYQHLQGKEIGIAMMNARKRAISKYVDELNAQ